MFNLKKMAVFAIGFVLVGCVAPVPIPINPDINQITRNPTTALIHKHVAYYISPELRAQTLKMAGGPDGAGLTYKPYNDSELAFYKMLTNVFTDVTRLKSLNDTATISKLSIDYIIVPEVVMHPEAERRRKEWSQLQFDVSLTCNITDSTGIVIATPHVNGNGSASFGNLGDEVRNSYMTVFYRSGTRATLDAMLKMQDKLQTLPELNIH